MENYLTQSGISLACFYVVYWLLVRHQQNFRLNRIFILFSISISAILPMIDIQLGIGQEQIGKALDPIIISDMGNQYLPSVTKTSYSIFSIVYIVGLVVFAIRSISGLATLFFFYWRNPSKNYHGFKAVILHGKQSPFTFFNLLFINQSDYERGKIDELLIHEKVHRDQYHSIDLILMEILTIFHWFNPFVWLIKKDLKSEHEFLADEQVINKGFDKSRYQSLLLKSHEGMALYLANNFNYSILKKRLIMMTKQKSNRILKMNYMLALPALMLTTMVLFFNFQLEGQTGSVPDVMPQYEAGQNEFYKVVQKNILYPKQAREENIQGTVYISFNINKNGKVGDIKAEKSKHNLFEKVVVVAYPNTDLKDGKIDDLRILEDEGARIISLMGPFKPGEKNGKPVITRMTLPIEFILKPK